jgi:succinate dehydrogenase / fumarate reductase membrane anchor subunit
MQRLTAVALIPLGIWFAYSLAMLDTSSYAAVTVWLQRPLTGVLAVLTVIVVGYHSKLGIQVVVEDYVSNKVTRTVVLVLSLFAHIILVTTAVYAVLRVAFGAS